MMSTTKRVLAMLMIVGDGGGDEDDYVEAKTTVVVMTKIMQVERLNMKRNAKTAFKSYICAEGSRRRRRVVNHSST